MRYFLQSEPYSGMGHNSGLADVFGCSVTTAQRIKSSGKIDRAITQTGRTIVIDAELALELANFNNRRKAQTRQQ